MIKRAFITGIEGFTGRYLAAELHRAGYEVVGLAHHPESIAIPGVKEVYFCDLCDSDGLSRILEDAHPDVVAHLAGIAFVGHRDADVIYRTNIVGSRNLLEALCRLKRPLQGLLLASSANVYGNATAGALDEKTTTIPANDYAVSKLAMEFVAGLYKSRLPITIARPFNYTGVGQSDRFLLPKIVKHVKQGAPVIELGNLDVARDFSDVRTVVECYRKLLGSPAAAGQTYNVCSGLAYTLHDVLGLVRSISGLNFNVVVNPAFVRNNEVRTLCGNRSKLEGAVGPIGNISLAETLRWMIEAEG